MKVFIKRIVIFAPVIDLLILPFTIISTLWFRLVRFWGMRSAPFTSKLLKKVGVFPIVDHYYDPYINLKKLRKPLEEKRFLPGIDFNDNEQLEILTRFNFQKELLEIPKEKYNDLEYYYNNGSFTSGDSEYLYSLIRLVRPEKYIEVGSGFSTLMALRAFNANKKENDLYKFEMKCIEPFEMAWLERLPIEIIRSKVEEVNISFFDSLKENDILFIDSSHIIRPQGDVLFEFLEILPRLKQGVIVHVHDIFTPFDYPKSWLEDENRLWNEQYLLEAFLSCNNQFEVIGALTYLYHFHQENLFKSFPILKSQKLRVPGSFWFRRK